MRPVKLVMENEEQKDAIMSRLVNLRTAEEIYRQLSVRDDNTIEERELIRTYAEQAKKQNERDNTTEWKVKGNATKRASGEEDQGSSHIRVTTKNNERNNNSNKIFKEWSFGTVNIRSGKEKEEGAKMYAVVKEVNRAGLSFCCLQEVRYRNIGSKIIELDSGEKFEFHWCDQSRHKHRNPPSRHQRSSYNGY